MKTKQQQAEEFARAQVAKWVTPETDAEAIKLGVTEAQQAAVHQQFTAYAIECFLAGYEAARKRPADDC